MLTRGSSLHMAEIVRLPASRNIIKTLCDTSGISFTICAPGYCIIHKSRYKYDRLYELTLGCPEFQQELFQILESVDFALSPEIGEIFCCGVPFLISDIRSGKRNIFTLLCGPFLHDHRREEDWTNLSGRFFPSHDSASPPESDIVILRKKDMGKIKRIMRTCSDTLVQFYNERERSDQYISRMSSLYQISNTVNSTLKLEEVLKLVLDSAIRLLGAQAGSIMLLDEKAGAMRILVAHGLPEEIMRRTIVRIGEGISGGVAATGKPRLLLKGVRESSSFADRKKEEIKSAICVPLKAKGQVIGVLNISGKVDGDNFSRRDVRLLEIMASNAAAAIYNANLYLSLKEKAKELEALYGIGTTITSSMAKKKVLEGVLRSARRLLNAKKGSLMLIDREQGELRIEIAYGLPKKIQRMVRSKLGEGIAGKVALEGKPRLMLKGIKVSESRTEKEEREIPSAISVPVKVKENIIGVLNVSDSGTGENFTEQSVDLLMMLANQAAIAIENSRLLEELQELFIESISALANAIDARDPYTRGHSQRVTEYSLGIARRLGLNDAEIEYIQYAALLHDIGKIHIRDEILNKPGKLTDEEFMEIQRHPAYGAQIMEPVKRFRNIIPYIYHHHEKYAGKGYPLQLKGHDIPLAARIISVADSFDAMTSDRPYRKGFAVSKAIEELQNCSGTQFDPDVVDVFVKILEEERNSWMKDLLHKSLSQQSQINMLTKSSKEGNRPDPNVADRGKHRKYYENLTKS